MQNKTQSTSGVKIKNHTCKTITSKLLLLISFYAPGCSFISYIALLASYLVDSCYDAVGEGIEAGEDV